ncbi:sel1 repeat family protein [Salmonella enterica]|nr:sel1 repeat family protein [Salmonella enterica subsp. enterica serovar Derby]ECL4185531.1 sel1 repeat family protein [Salmonella enterica]ECG2980471.1 sel1 repeat family protein [Salmonella enterica subsp. enterica serovar Derby]ECO2322199.1 sel1 repeat family protein [Salmonella enterica]ECP0017908.1 sel1 repeat family protein [Salmonella enterica]
MRFVIVFIMLIVSFYTFGGKMTKSKDGNKWRSESTSTIYNLTDGQKFELEKKSKDGDSEASFRLYQYYCFTINNIDEQLRYLEISASQGNIIAQYNYGIYLSNTNPAFSKYYDLDKAIYWMGLASKNGDIGAQNKLQELEKLKN